MHCDNTRHDILCTKSRMRECSLAEMLPQEEYITLLQALEISDERMNLHKIPRQVPPGPFNQNPVQACLVLKWGFGTRKSRTQLKSFFKEDTKPDL